MQYRTEHDSMGEIRVPADKYWGAQTQRSIQNFPIGVGYETMPQEIIRAFGILKKAAAMANRTLRPEKMTEEKYTAICAACGEVMDGTLLPHFPLVVWQTGSGTQSNMNANEVIANRGNAIAGKPLLHPNDDINMSQSSNDTFPTAMHIAAVCAIEDRVLPALDTLIAAFVRLEKEHAGIVKSGRTHLQDATPIAFSQEISGWRSSLERTREQLLASLPGLKELALGGTAVGTGLNAPAGFDREVAAAVSQLTGKAVIANRGNAIAGKPLLHPNDDINMSQSSNDTFPTAMHIAAVCAIEDRVLPALDTLIAAFVRLEKEHAGIVKSGRTHLQDATPIAFSQEISGWRSSLERTREQLLASLPGLKELALGGTAVGTGLNAPAGFDREVAAAVSQLTGKAFTAAPNKFHALTSKSELVFAHAALKALAADLMKIANDIRWLASGPRLGLGEITIPENEPGSSIMPGKVNPTQCEAVTMVAVQVMGNDTAVGIAASQGNFQLNVFMPVLIYNFLQSARLLAEAMTSFHDHCVTGIRANREKMHRNLQDSLMLVTALNPYIGYENAAKTAKKAYAENISLKEACVSLGFLTEDQFDEVFHPEQMI